MGLLRFLTYELGNCIYSFEISTGIITTDNHEDNKGEVYLCSKCFFEKGLGNRNEVPLYLPGVERSPLENSESLISKVAKKVASQLDKCLWFCPVCQSSFYSEPDNAD